MPRIRGTHSCGGAHLNIVFQNRSIAGRSFSAYMVNGELCLPRIFQPLCEAQGLDTAEKFLDFAGNDTTTVSVLLESKSLEEYRDKYQDLERTITAPPPVQSEDLTPAGSSVDETADTPLMPDAAPNDETAAAE